MTARAPVRVWTEQDVEDATCCVCGVSGRSVYDVPPFAVVRCPRCGLVFVSPRLRPAALQEVYDDVGYFEGGVYGADRSPAMRLQRVWTRGRLALLPPATSSPRLLEIGCGYGHFLVAARERGHEVAGVELSRPAVRHAVDVLGLDVTQGQLADAGLSGGYDVITAWDTLEHVPDPVAFLRTVHGLLAPDGMFAFSTPYISALPARLLGRRWWTLKPAEHIWHFTPEHHRLVLARAGFGPPRLVRSPLSRANFGRFDSLVGLARRPA